MAKLQSRQTLFKIFMALSIAGLIGISMPLLAEDCNELCRTSCNGGMQICADAGEPDCETQYSDCKAVCISNCLKNERAIKGP